MHASKKIVVTTTVDLDDLEYPAGNVTETAASQARAITNDRQMLIRTSRGRIVCREIAPNTYLGLTSERRRMSLLQIDENIFIFAPARLPKHRLEHLITHLISRYGIAPTHQEEPASTYETFTSTAPLA